MRLPASTEGKQGKCPKCKATVIVSNNTLLDLENLEVQQQSGEYEVPKGWGKLPGTGKVGVAPCPDCGHQVSKKGNLKCPNCGRWVTAYDVSDPEHKQRMAKAQTLGVKLAIGCFVMFIVGFVGFVVLMLTIPDLLKAQ